jgi:hypothetical protein
VRITAYGDEIEPRELARALAAYATAAGVAEDTADNLHKSDPDPADHMPTEASLLQITGAMVAVYDQTVEALGLNLGRWFAAQFGAKKRWVLAKALPNLQLTPNQIEELRLLIETHFRPAFLPAVQGVVGFGPISISGQPPIWGIPPDVWARWVDDGIVVAGMPIPQISDAYTAGRLYQVIHEGSTFQEMIAAAATIPLTRPQVLGIAWAEQHAAQYVRGFGQVQAGKAAGLAISQNQRIARTLITEYLAGKLKTTPAHKVPAHNLTPEERTSLESNATAEHWKTLASEMYKTFKGTDAKRDWMRVAVSETRLAYNAGRLGQMEAQGVAHVYFMVRPTACDACKKVYLHPDGSPRIFPIKELMDNVEKTGGVNVGRKASLIGKPGGWLATLLLHPFCRCRPMPYTGHAPFGPAMGV